MKALIVLLLSIPALCKDINVLEIDTGVESVSHPEINSHIEINSGFNFNYIDLIGHGTFIAGLILKNTCKEVKLKSCSYYMYQNSTEKYLKCLQQAIDEKPDVVNISGGGEDYIQKEYDLIKQLEILNIPVIVAMGNGHHDLKTYDYWPAKYNLKNIIPVCNLNENGLDETSNYGLKTMVCEIGTNIGGLLPWYQYGIMTGTSMSTAIHTNKLLLKKCEEIHNKVEIK